MNRQAEKVESLNRRLCALEIYRKAEAHFRDKAREVLQDVNLPVQERIEKTLQILVSYDPSRFGDVPNAEMINFTGDGGWSGGIVYQADYGDSKSTAV